MPRHTRHLWFGPVLAAAALLGTSLASQAAVTYNVSFSGATLYDLQGNDTGETYSGSYSFTLPSYLSGAETVTPDNCTLSANATAYYFCRPTQDLDPNGFNTGKNFAGFGIVNNDLSGSGTGFLWFETGSFTADGVYPLFAGTITDGVNLYGNFAPEGSLVVRSDPNGVPSPTPLTLLTMAGAALAWHGRRRSTR